MVSIKNTVRLVLPLALMALAARADDDFEEFRRHAEQSFDDFSTEARTDYANFRDQVNREYEDFMRSHPWTPTEIREPLPMPIEKEPEPDVEPEEEQSKPVEKPKPIVIETVLNIHVPQPQPQPIEPIEPTPVKIDEEKEPLYKVEFYGTEMAVRPVDLSGFRLMGADQNAFADGWAYLSGQDLTNNLISDCLSVREKYQLPDWGYMKFLDSLASNLKGAETNEKTLLLGFLLNQSGYKTRFALDEQQKLHLLFTCKGIMYNQPRYYMDGEWLYSYTKPEGTDVKVCNFAMPKEQDISMAIDRSPLFAYAPGTQRDITTKRHPELKLSLTPNKNLIDFFGDYPEATLDSNPLSLWMIHGNTPVSQEVREQVYPELRKAVEGKSQLEAVGLLLKVAQSFPYEYDEELWGRDRAFWMEESWEYPYSDCEDHSINFTHMVRDILGLDACLVYYPGHLSSCVAITEGDVRGDYIDHDGKRYYVCDPTYFYAGVGKTGPSNDNAEAVLLPLRK